MSAPTVTCPTCGQPWPNRSGRVCGLCHLPIGRHHRWHTVGSVVQHHDCANPTLAAAAPSSQLLIEAAP